MQPSMEVRWFRHEELPETIEQWFRRGYIPKQDAALDDESRDDVYYKLPVTKTLSFKLRPARKSQGIEGVQRFDKVEVKQQLGEAGMQILRPGVEGQVGQWVKWSLDLLQKNEKDEPVLIADVFTPPGYWIIVKKRRLTRKFEISISDKVIAVDATTQRPHQGCNMELAWLEVNGQKWWSLGFEAFGLLENVEKNLQLVLRQVLADPTSPEMKAEQSYAYPAWLEMVLKSATNPA